MHRTWLCNNQSAVGLFHYKHHKNIKPMKSGYSTTTPLRNAWAIPHRTSKKKTQIISCLKPITHHYAANCDQHAHPGAVKKNNGTADSSWHKSTHRHEDDLTALIADSWRKPHEDAHRRRHWMHHLEPRQQHVEHNITHEETTPDIQEKDREEDRKQEREREREKREGQTPHTPSFARL